MKFTYRSIAAILLAGFVLAGSVRTVRAEADPTPSDGDQASETLSEINQKFKNVNVHIVHWPDELNKELEPLKKYAFVALPKQKPSGKIPLLITLHGGGGKEMNLQKQLERSARVKGLALAELAGKEMILLEPNSADSWNPDSLDRMLDHVLEHHPEIDKSRVYVMGHSMGGSGTWNWILQSADRFAAAAPCGFSSGTSTDGIENLVDLPIWGMVGGADGNNVAAIQKMVDNLRAAGNDNVRHTAFPEANHSQGNAAVFSSVDCVDWMLTFSRSE